MISARPLRGLAFLLVAAAAVRVAFAVVFLRDPIGAMVPLDTEAYRALAHAIAALDFGHPGFDYLNPPYAFMLAPFASLLEERARVVVTAVQILMDTAVVALTYVIAARCFSAGAALAAAALYAFYGTAVFYSATVLPVTLSVLGMTSALAALLMATDRRPGLWPRRRLDCFWLLPGAALGIFILTRPNGLVLLPIVALSMRRASWRSAAFLLAGLALVLSPFSLRSVQHGTGLSPFPVNGGINFYIGNNPLAQGRYVHVPNVADKPGDQVQTSVDEASRRVGRPMDAREASAFWVREGLAWIAREPAAALVLTLEKAGTFFRGEEPPLNISYDFARENIGLLRACLGLGVILPLALWGMAAALADGGLRRDRHVRLVMGALLAYAASVIAFFVSDRYRMPVVPLLAVFAGHGASMLIADVRARRRRAAVAVAAVAAAAVFVNYPFTVFSFAPDGVDHVRLSDVFIDRGEYDRAMAECLKAAAISPRKPDTLFCLATAHYFRKEYFEAEMGLRDTIASQVGTPSDLPARKNLAHVLKEQGLFEEALREAADDAQRAEIRAGREAFKGKTPDLPGYARAQLAEGTRRQHEGDLPGARYALRRAVEADPTLAEAHLALATVGRDLHLGGEACEAAREAARRMPGDARASGAATALCQP